MPTKPYYELHVTIMCDREPGVLQRVIEAYGWTFSRIDKDIILGEGIKCYATHHMNKRQPYNVVQQSIENCATTLNRKGFNVIRTKIEEVLYDNRNPFPEG